MGTNLGHPENNVIKGLITILDNNKIPCVSWKNNHELDNSLDAERDVDLFVPSEFRRSFLILCSMDGWLHVENPIARFPWVIHLYKQSNDEKLFHLHVYFKIVTGESWLKEYLLPVDNLLIENRVYSDAGIWILNSQTQSYLFAIRHLLKGASIFSRLLYIREFESYRDEWLSCVQARDMLEKFGTVSVSKYLDNAGLSPVNLSMPKIRTALRFRVSLSPYLRFSAWSLPFRRVGKFISRLFNRYYYKRRKILPHNGLIFAITGVDGAGKTTMLSEAFSLFSQFLTVDCYSLGKPQGRIIETLRKLVKRKKEHKVSIYNDDDHISRSLSVGKSLTATFLALLRLRVARKAMRSAFRGHLVLTDRWPTAQVDKMDGPRLANLSNSNWMIRACTRLESWAYARMPMADVCIFLELPLEVALERNRMRVKEEKESDREIINRFNQNREFSPLALKTVIFRNDGDLTIMRTSLLKSIWTELIEH